MPSLQHTSNLIERKQYMQVLRARKEQNVIKVLTGVRRCGKSTLLEMFAEELRQQGIEEAQIQFLNFEDLDTLAIGDIFQIHTHIKERLIPDRMNYIFLDEVQNIKDFQRLVDSLYIKKNCDVYITGSNAYLLSGELATLLTGRYIETEVLPFSYAEYTDFLNLYSQKSQENESFGNRVDLLKLTKSESFRDFIYYGGIPEVYNLLFGEVSSQFLPYLLEVTPTFITFLSFRNFIPAGDMK